MPIGDNATLPPAQPGRRKRASDHFLWHVTTKVIGNQPELFEGEDVKRELWEIFPDIFSPHGTTLLLTTAVIKSTAGQESENSLYGFARA
jgi:hypothetical protein